MSKRTTRYERLHEGKTTTGPTRFTRLSKDSDQEVNDLVTDDYPRANVIRDLVDEALHVRHLNKAGRHPAVRELLRTFDEIINVRFEPLNQRLARMELQLAQGNRFLAALFITIAEKFEFSTESSNDELDDLLFSACADEANTMSQLILNRKQPVAQTDNSQPTLRPLVAQELSPDRTP